MEEPASSARASETPATVADLAALAAAADGVADARADANANARDDDDDAPAVVAGEFGEFMAALASAVMSGYDEDDSADDDAAIPAAVRDDAAARGTGSPTSTPPTSPPRMRQTTLDEHERFFFSERAPHHHDRRTSPSRRPRGGASASAPTSPPRGGGARGRGRGRRRGALDGVARFLVGVVVGALLAVFIASTASPSTLTRGSPLFDSARARSRASASAADVEKTGTAPGRFGGDWRDGSEFRGFEPLGWKTPQLAAARDGSITLSKDSKHADADASDATAGASGRDRTWTWKQTLNPKRARALTWGVSAGVCVTLLAYCVGLFSVEGGRVGVVGVVVAAIAAVAVAAAIAAGGGGAPGTGGIGAAPTDAGPGLLLSASYTHRGHASDSSAPAWVSDARVATWGCRETTRWLRGEFEGSESSWAAEYGEALCGKGVTGLAFAAMDESDLRATLGVKHRGHRRKMLAAAWRLKDKAGREEEEAEKRRKRRRKTGEVRGQRANGEEKSEKSSAKKKSSAEDAKTSAARRGGGVVPSLASWKAAAPASRAAQIMGVTNCPRLRMLRDVTVGDGSLANLAGLYSRPPRTRDDDDDDANIAGSDDPSASPSPSPSPSPRLNLPLLGLWFLCPGFIVALRAHELWGLSSFPGVFGAVLGFALVAMFAQGNLDIARRWERGTHLETRWARNRVGVAGARLRAIAMARNAAVLATTRTIYPGLARALMLEALTLATFSAPKVVGSVAYAIGAVALPTFRVGYRVWYVTGRGGFGESPAAWRRAAARRREEEQAAAVTAANRATAIEQSQAMRRLERANSWGEEGRGNASSNPGVSSNPADAIEAAIDDLFSNEEMDDVARQRHRARARAVADAAAAVGRVRGTELGGGEAALPRGRASEAPPHDIASRRDRSLPGTSSSTSSSSSSSSRSHWPGPVVLPEWLNDERAPSHFRCPITLCVIREPAVTPAGITYERAALMRWLEHQHTEPSTKQRLKRSHVVPNLTLRAMIEDWLQEQKRERRRAANRAAASIAAAGGDAAAAAAASASVDAPSSGPSSPSTSSPSTALPPGATGVLQADRDRLRAARLRMYAALKERAAANVSAEEQRFAHWAATNATSNAFAHAAAASIRTSSGGGGAEAADEAELETPATVATAERGGEEIVPVADDGDGDGEGEGEGEGARSRGGDGDDDGATREDDSFSAAPVAAESVAEITAAFLEHDAHPSTASASAVVSLIARSDPRAFAAAVNAVVLPPGHPRDPAALLPAVSQRVRQDQPEARVLRHRPLPPVDAAAAAAEEDEEEGDASSLVAS